MNNNKGKGAAGLIVLLAILAAFIALAAKSISSIPLGLDLNGGASITYEAVKDNPTEQEMSDTIFKLQRRVSQVANSNEAQVYREGTRRINIDIPGATDANSILAELGKPGSLQFLDPDGKVILTGDQVKSAQAGTSTNQTTGASEYIVQLTFNDEGTASFAEATTRLVGQPIYIMYDGIPASWPTVREPITGGQCRIDGLGSYEEADRLAATIRIGSLSLELRDIHSKVVGAQLGKDAISTSLKAGAVGFCAIALIMIAIFWLPGLAAALALALYIAVTVCLLAAFNITMTLSGIAGIILSVGMAVDANVIIFTRIREEIGLGKTPRSAVKTGFRKALSAIIDGNVTTLIAAIVLYLMGTGSIKGFAQTLMLGVVVSMFSAIIITRAWLYTFCDLGFDNVKFFGVKKTGKILEVIGKKKLFFGIAAVCIVIGWIAMGMNAASGKGALNLGIDFAGGTSTTVGFNEDLNAAAIEADVVPLIHEITNDNELVYSKVTGSNDIIFKTRTLTVDEQNSLTQKLSETFAIDKSGIQMETISGTISGEMRRDAIIAVLIALVLMLVYIRIRFADVRFAVSAILCLVHDVLIVLTCFALFRWSVGTSFVACMLTLVGYSINDTIVVFDRIRENQKIHPELSRRQIADLSITETISRSVLTSVTTFVTIFILFLLGVSAMRDFTIPLMIGTVCGTYSSVAIASPLWNVLEERRDKKKAEEKAAEKAQVIEKKSRKKEKGSGAGKEGKKS